MNILKRGLATAGHAGNYAWGDWPSWAVGANLRSNGESREPRIPVSLERGVSKQPVKKCNNALIML
ncbi:putative transposase [Arthrospira platensis NIES-39]|nr:putative transposase [Arthrospira platensis NIES-39]